MSLATKQTLLETLGAYRIALFYKDVCGRYLFINQSGAELLNRSVDQATGASDHQLFLPRSADIVRLRDLHVCSTREPQSYASRSTVLESGRTTHFYSVKQAVRTQRGAPAGLIGLSVAEEFNHDLGQILLQTLGLLMHRYPADLLQFCRRGAQLKVI